MASLRPNDRTSLPFSGRHRHALSCLLMILSLGVSFVPRIHAAPMPRQDTSKRPAASSLQEPELQKLLDEGMQAYERGEYAVAAKAGQEGLEKAKAIPSEKATVAFLDLLGHIYWRWGRFDKALDYYSRALAIKEKFGNPQEIAAGLDNLGNVYRRSGQSKKAQEYHTLALTKREKLGDMEGLGASLNNLGHVNYNIGQYVQALDYYTRALATHEKLAPSRNLAFSLSGMGVVNLNQGRPDKAFDYLERARVLFEKYGHPQDLARTLDNLGYVYNGLNEPMKAKGSFSRALALREKLGNQLEIANSLKNMGIVYIELEDYEKAKEVFSRACTCFVNEDNLQGLSSILAGLGHANFYAPNEQIIPQLNRAFTLFEKAGDDQGRAACLLALGNTYIGLGLLNKAMECFREALHLAEKLKDPHYTAAAYISLGTVNDRLGLFSTTIGFLTQALVIHEQHGTIREKVFVLEALAGFCTRCGQYDKALDYLSRSLLLREESGYSQEKSRTLNLLGTTYYGLGQYEKALDFHLQALALDKKQGSPLNIARSLNHTGNLYSQLDQPTKALEDQMDSLALREKIGDLRGIADCQNNIGGTYMNMGRFLQAEYYFNLSLQTREKLSLPAEIAGSYLNLGGFYTRSGQLDKALASLTKVLPMMEGLGNPQNVAICHDKLGDVYARLGQPETAEKHYALALHLFEQVGQLVGEPAGVGAYQETLPHFYERYASFLLLQRQRPDRALEMVERGRGAGLSRQLILNQTNYTAVFTHQERTQLAACTTELVFANHLRRALQEKLASVPNDQKPRFQQPLAEATTRHQEAERQFTLLRDSLFARYPQFRNVSGEQAPTAAQLQNYSAKHPDTFFLEWVLVDEKTTLLFALAQGQLKVFTLPVGSKTLNALTQQWRSALTNPLQDPAAEKQIARQLYQTLLAPVEKAGWLPAVTTASTSAPKKGKTTPAITHLVLVGSGPLFDVPLSALLDTQGRRLIERFSISTAISLGIFLWRETPRSPSAPLLCAADPLGSETKPKQFASRRDTFGALPEARKEGEAVVGLYPGATLRVGKEAREAELKRTMGKYGILHFATHGDLPERNFLRSGLVLANESEGSKEDGILEAREVLNLPLSAQMAVLSACETGRGKVSGGEGLMGLAWAFRAAGCPCVVASQWKVADEATAQMMVAFYNQLKAKKNKDEALRTAMLKVKQSKPHPYYWAAFQVIGDTSPIR